MVENVEDLYISLAAKNLIASNGLWENKPWGYKEFFILDNCSN